VSDVPTYWPVVQPLGFMPIGSEPVAIGDRAYASVWLDFGPESVDGWLGRLAAGELEVHEPIVLDDASHELIVDGTRAQLTPLEFGVLKLLREAGGSGVSRDRLLDQVWGYDFDGGSNVVDAVVSGLRQKLGARRDLLETVRGVGYRLREA
jgi:DNA-binding response OmpR family regulator